MSTIYSALDGCSQGALSLLRLFTSYLFLQQERCGRLF
jgi:hypothetical protein